MFLVFRVGTAASGVELQVLSNWNTYFYLVLILEGNSEMGDVVQNSGVWIEAAMLVQSGRFVCRNILRTASF